jgi:hypothetical protein
MPAKLIIAPEAEQDLAEAYAWYEDRRIGLGEEFLTSKASDLRIQLCQMCGPDPGAFWEREKERKHQDERCHRNCLV